MAEASVNSGEQTVTVTETEKPVEVWFFSSSMFSWVSARTVGDQP